MGKPRIYINSKIQTNFLAHNFKKIVWSHMHMFRCEMLIVPFPVPQIINILKIALCILTWRQFVYKVTRMFIIK